MGYEQVAEKGAQNTSWDRDRSSLHSSDLGQRHTMVAKAVPDNEHQRFLQRERQRLVLS